MASFILLEEYLRSPRQATDVFGLDGPGGPRKKGLFYVRFARSDGGQATSGLADDLGFVVKSIDRPSVEPQIEELHQYNKKRQVTTGYKFSPMRVVFYDTADNLAMRMWTEYAQYYFGDFNQDDQSSFRYDVTLGEMYDNGQGFGYVPRNGGSNAGVDSLSTDQNSQFFFDRIEVYQVWGASFTQFDLVNPKIKQFDPDELDYTVSDVGMITMTVAYEAILYRNNGNPIPITENEILSGVFGGGPLDGNVIPVPGAPRRGQTVGREGAVLAEELLDQADAVEAEYLRRYTSLDNPVLRLDGPENSFAAGALSMFGNYDFGTLNAANRLTGNLVGDVSYLATGAAGLSSLLNLPNNTRGSALSTTNRQPAALPNDRMDTGRGATGAVTKYAKEYVEKNLLGGITASAKLDNNSVKEQVSRSDQGIRLSNQSYGVVNAQRPSYSQIGYNGSKAPELPIPVKPLKGIADSVTGRLPAAPVPFLKNI